MLTYRKINDMIRCCIILTYYFSLSIFQMAKMQINPHIIAKDVDVPIKQSTLAGVTNA